MGEKHPYYRKSMSISFPDFPNAMSFLAFSRTVGNLWENPGISRMITLVIFFPVIASQQSIKMNQLGISQS